MGTAIKYPVPDWVKLSFVIFDIQALSASAVATCKGLSLWCPLLQCGYCYKASCARLGRVPFVIFDIWALWCSGLSVRVPGCQNYEWRLNPVWHMMLYCCTHMAIVGVRGIILCMLLLLMQTLMILKMIAVTMCTAEIVSAVQEITGSHRHSAAARRRRLSGSCLGTVQVPSAVLSWSPAPWTSADSAYTLFLIIVTVNTIRMLIEWNLRLWALWSDI